MPLSHDRVGSKIVAKIKIYILTRAELLINLCYEIPCIMQALHVAENFKNVCPSDYFFIVLNHFVKLHHTYQMKDNTYYIDWKKVRRAVNFNQCEYI